MAALSVEEVDRLLAEPQIAVLCTVDSRGQPQGSPVWFGYENGAIVVLAHRDSKKTRDIRENAKVCITVDTRRSPYRGVMLQGVAIVSGPDPALRRRLALRYLAPAAAERYLAKTSHLDAEDALITVRITRRYSWDYSKGV
jgi:PPOX class probable F420-dependent enzyme